MEFEDLEVWKRTARLSAEVYKRLARCENYGYRDQITRSSLSIPSNIAEGFERESNKACLNVLAYAKGTCGELRTPVYIGIDIGYIEKKTGKRWLRETKEISSMLAGLIKTRRDWKLR